MEEYDIQPHFNATTLHNIKGNVAMNVLGFSKNGLSKSRGLICNGDFIELVKWIIFNQQDTLQFFIRFLKPSFLPVISPYLGNNPFVPAHLDPQPTIGSGEQLVAQSGHRRKENPRGVCLAYPFFGCMPDIVLRNSSNFLVILLGSNSHCWPFSLSF